MGSHLFTPRSGLNLGIRMRKTYIFLHLLACNFNKCSPRISGSHTNYIRRAELRTSSKRTLAVTYFVCAELNYGREIRGHSFADKGHSALLRLAYRFESEKLLIPPNQVDTFYILITEFKKSLFF
jgi:hypothetical protein